jgi:hypothetical protein
MDSPDPDWYRRRTQCRKLHRYFTSKSVSRYRYFTSESVSRCRYISRGWACHLPQRIILLYAIMSCKRTLRLAERDYFLSVWLLENITEIGSVRSWYAGEHYEWFGAFSHPAMSEVSVSARWAILHNRFVAVGLSPCWLWIASCISLPLWTRFISASLSGCNCLGRFLNWLGRMCTF